MKHGKLKQEITQIRNQQGDMVVESAAVAKVFVDYYEHPLREKDNTRVSASEDVI